MKLLGPFGKTKPLTLLVFDLDGELKDISDLCCVQYPELVEAEQKDLISKSAQLSLVNICVSFLLSRPMLLFSWTESDLLPLDEMFADCQLGLSQHSAYYRIVKHTKCRPTTLVTADSH